MLFFTVKESILDCSVIFILKPDYSIDIIDIKIPQFSAKLTEVKWTKLSDRGSWCTKPQIHQWHAFRSI